MRINAALLGVCLCSALALPVAADATRAPSGWKEATTDRGRVLSKGTSEIVVGRWASLEGRSLKEHLEDLEKTVPANAEFVSSKGVKSERIDGAYAVTRKIRLNGKSGQSVLYGCPGKPGFGRVLSLTIESAKFGDAISGGMFLEKACKNEPKGGAEESVAGALARVVEAPPETHASTTAPARTATASIPTSAALAPVEKLDGLKELRGVIVFGIQAGGMFGLTEDFIALFEDGSYSSDLARTFGKSKAASRQKKPKYWGQWRMRGGELELKEDGDEKFDTTRGNWVAPGGDADHRLSKCYGNITSSSGGDYTSGTTVGLARSWCFYPNGRFTNKASAFGSSSNPSASMGVSNKARGRYRIDGNMARFVYDDGHEVVAAFGFVNKDRTHIMLNGKRFMGN